MLQKLLNQTQAVLEMTDVFRPDAPVQPVPPISKKSNGNGDNKTCSANMSKINIHDTTVRLDASLALATLACLLHLL